MADIADHAQNGFEEITGTLAGKFTGFLVIGSDGATVAATSSVGDNLSSIALAEGMYIPGVFSSIQVTAGTVLGIRKNQP